MRKHEKERERERERIIQPLVRSITNLYIPPSSRLHSTCTNIVNSGSHLPGVPCLLHRGENGSIRAEAFASCSPSIESLNTPWLSCSIGAAPGTWKRWEGKRGGGLEKTAAEKERESRCVRVARGRPRKEKGTRDGYINRTVRTCPVEFKEFTPASNNVPDPCVWSRVTDEPSR